MVTDIHFYDGIDVVFGNLQGARSTRLDGPETPTMTEGGGPRTEWLQLLSLAFQKPQLLPQERSSAQSPGRIQ